MRYLLIVLAHGYILFFVSERVFWSFFRPEDDFRAMIITWLVYSLCAWLMLILVRFSHAAALAPLFLCGAVFGWLAEGIVVDTFYGDPTNPLPWSISYTGLSWHALLSVLLGWACVGRLLKNPSGYPIAALSVMMGLGWGVWAWWWPAAADAGTDVSVAGFAWHTAVFSAPWLIAWGVLGVARPRWFRPGRLAAITLWSIAILVFITVHAPAKPIVAWLLPAMVAICVAALTRHAYHAERKDILDGLLGHIRLQRLAALALTPITAVMAYAAGLHLAPAAPMHIVTYLLTMPLGFALLIWSWWVLLMRPMWRSAGNR